MKFVRDRALEKEIMELEKNTNGKCTFHLKNNDTEPKSLVAELRAAHYVEPQQIACKWCGNTDIMKYGIRHGVQEYICRACGRKFTEKDSPYHMQTPTEQIGASLNMFYDGMSVADIARHLDETYHNPVNASTVYRWIIRYTFMALSALDSTKPMVSDTWMVDETVIKVGEAIFGFGTL